MVNIAKKGNVERIFLLIENEIAQFDTAMSLWKNNNGWEYIEEAISMSKDKVLNVGKYYDDVENIQL